MRKILFIDVDGFALIQFRGPLLKRLTESGIDVTVGSSHFREVDRTGLERIGCTVVQFPMQRTGINPLKDRACKSGIESLIRSERPDILVARAGKAVAYALPIARRLGVRRRIGLMTGLGTMFYPGSIKEHLLAPVARRLMLKGLRAATEIWTLNEDNTRLLEELGATRGGSRIHCMDSDGVDLEKFPASPLPEHPTFTFIGRLMTSKGFDLFLEAAQQALKEEPGMRFIVAGEPDRKHRSESQSQLEQMSAEGSLQYEGFVDDLPELLKRSSCIVLPSYHEGRPRSVLEALATGRPVVVSDAVGCRDVIEHEVHGLIVPIGNAMTLASSMVQLARHQDQISQMGAAARRLAETRYAENVVVDRFMNRLFTADPES
ncbi:MAG: hypothetical protein CBC35_00635 [Planctomycetes bacterium TMED75]|nr:hypothetical protein [Planctomycetaceae bacterium]OUU96768.1 MAG: hypothetical protein CBC35_00635 [Planctomycetes bacterium TMED75]